VLEIIFLTLFIIAAFVAASWYAHHRSQARARAFEKELDFHNEESGGNFQAQFDALLDNELSEQPTSNSDDSPQPDLFAEPVADSVIDKPVKTEAAPLSSDEAEETSAVADWDMVIAFTIMAPEGQSFKGQALKTAFESHDLHFGDMHIFHKYTAGSHKQSLFSVANIIEPGTLVPDTFPTLTTPGLLVFTRLPGPINGLTLFDDLMDVSHSLTSALGGVLCDEQRTPVDDAVLESMRSRILDYQMAIEAETSQQTNDYLDRH
jgi:cell division protein ZipA